jgi:hypothetical protein
LIFSPGVWCFENVCKDAPYVELQNGNWWRWRFDSCNFFVGC